MKTKLWKRLAALALGVMSIGAFAGCHIGVGSNNGSGGDTSNKESIGDEVHNGDGYDKPSIHSEGLEYRLSDDKTYYIVTGKGNCMDTDIVIPETYNALPVKEIGMQAFLSCNGLDSVIIPNSVTSIGISAFADCNSLSSVTIPNSVINIDNYAFSNCTRLNGLIIPDGIVNISSWAFNNCSKLNFIEFGNCKYLGNSENPYLVLMQAVGMDFDDYIIHEKTKVIADYAFAECSALTSISIPNSVIHIGKEAFDACVNLTDVTIGNCVKTIGALAFYKCQSLRSLTIPDSVTTIGKQAFYWCRSLTNVTIGDGVKSIEEYAFNSCSSLTSVTIPSGIKSIGQGAFYACSSLTSVYYKGTESEWSENYINSFNTPFIDAMRYYYSESEPMLNTDATAYDGNYWYYSEHGEIIVWVYTKES